MTSDCILHQVSREHLSNKSLVLYFEGKTKDEELMRAMQQAYSHFGCEEQSTGLFEVIYLTAAQTPSEFATSFRHMPWLSLPFTHALRREQLRHLFEVNEEKDAVVLLHMDGSTITRDGKQHMKLAYRCQTALNDKQQENKHQLELTKLIEKERKQLITLEKRLRKGVVARLERCTAQLIKHMRLREFEEFTTEQDADLPPKLRADLAAVEKAVEEAREKLRAIDAASLEQLRTASDAPNAELSVDLRESLEAVGVLFSLKADVSAVQTRLMARGAEAFRERLLGFNKMHVPPTARARLRKFLSGGRSSDPLTTALPSDALRVQSEQSVLATALREWVTALVNFEAVSAEESIAREQNACTPVMQAACECLCDLHGMHTIEDDLRGALLMAGKFEALDPTTVADKVEEDQEVVRLQEQANTLKKFVSLMDQGLKDAVKAVPTLQDSIRNSDFTYSSSEVPGHMAMIMSPQGRASESHAAQNAATSLLKATIWISKPLMLQSGGSQGETRSTSEIIEEASKIFNELVGKIREAVNDTASETIKPAPDVTEAEWTKFSQLIEGIHHSTIQHSYLLTSWHKWANLVSELYRTKSGLIAKRTAAKKAKEQLAAITKQLDDSSADSPFSLALMHSVAQAAKDLGATLTHEALLWVLHRSKGDERVAISLAAAQSSARKVLRVLRDPKLLSSFDVSQVTSAMVGKVRETLKGEAMLKVCNQLDAIDEEAGRLAAARLGSAPSRAIRSSLWRHATMRRSVG